MMNEETRLFIESFDSHFRKYRDIPVVLYGIGEKTQWILENLPVYRIAGLMDQDTTGKTVYGKKVLTFEEAAEQAKIIIIVASMPSNRIIYNRIRSLHETHHIPVFFTDGTPPDHGLSSTATALPGGESVSSIRERIQSADVVSFDLFDTLIMRETYLPTDVFDIVEEHAKDRLCREFSFKVPRIAAEKHCFSRDEFYNLEAIYEQLRAMLDVEPAIISQLQQSEIETELQLSRPRTDVADLYLFARSRGKRICITTDTYLAAETVAMLLQNVGIPPPHELFISNVERKSKRDGTLWEHIRKRNETQAVLHIGDNDVTDGEQPRSRGIPAVLVAGGSDLLNMALGPITHKARYSIDRRILGLISSRFLNSPFSLIQSQGKIPLTSMTDLGYLCFGPLVYAYIRWLIGNVRDHPEARVLFFARDGYLLKELYDTTARALKIPVPEGMYLLTSRRSASVLSLEKEADIAFVTRSMCRYRKNTLRESLFLAFGIRGGKDDHALDRRCLEMTDDEIIRYLTEKYGAAILANARAERGAYLTYLDSLGLGITDPLYCVNFVGRGATQQFISGILKKPIDGYYFALEKAPKESFFGSVSAGGLYDSFPGEAEASQLLRHYVYGETILSAPEEQFIRFSEDGIPVYDTRPTVRDFSRIQECHDGIREFFKDVLMIQYTDNELPSLDLVDELYGLFLSGRCTVSETVRNSLVFKDYYDASSPAGTVLEI
jgi:hypothetical protein